MKEAPKNSEAWSDYWEKGFLTTFTAEKGDNYSGLIKGFWWKQFDQLDDGACIVDLGAGNGAILTLAIEFMREHERNFELVAVDYANIQNSSTFYQNNKFIRVLGNTSIEDMAIESDTIDLCTSQYGFEYADSIKATKEVSRVLKKKGKFCALIHHNRSSVTKASNLMIHQIELCQKSELTKIVQQLLKKLDKLKRTKLDPRENKKASKLRDSFNQVAANLLQNQKQPSNQDHISYYLGELSGVFSQRAKGLSLKEKLRLIQSVEQDSRSYKLRMEAMLSASHDESAMKELSKIFHDFNFDNVEFEELRSGEEITWSFIASNFSG